MYAKKLISVPLYMRHQRAYKQRCEKTGKTAKRALQRQRAGPFFFIDVIVNLINRGAVYSRHSYRIQHIVYRIKYFPVSRHGK